MMEQTPNGIQYNWELAGANGAAFMLYPSETNTKEDIQAAKLWLKDNRDVVYISVADESDLDELYRTHVFKHPYCRPLQWFEINADDMQLIRKCRREGMCIQCYVNTYVVGKEAETTEANKLKFKHRGDITNS